MEINQLGCLKYFWQRKKLLLSYNNGAEESINRLNEVDIKDLTILNIENKYILDVIENGLQGSYDFDNLWKCIKFFLDTYPNMLLEFF